MSDYVKADGIVLYAKLGTNYYPIACGTSISITTTSDKIELAPYTSGKWRSFIYNRISGTITGSGLIKIDAGNNLYSVFDLIAFQYEQLFVLAKYIITDPNGNSKTYEVNCLVDEVTLNTDAGGAATYNFSLSMTSDPEFIQTPVDTGGDNVQAWDYTATGGETSISDAVLINNEVIDIRRNGVGVEIIFSGTPNTNQVKFTPSTGLIEFGYALGAGEYILVIYVD
jgi:hypothetical protein